MPSSRRKKRFMRTFWTLLILGSVVGAVVFLSNFQTETSESEENINKLALHMEQLYRRELEKDRFSMHYIPKPPATILITIQSYPDANRQLILTLTQSAREIIQRTSHTFNVETVNVETHTEELPPSH